MSSLIILRHVKVENANAIAGLTYGFPAITHFLGYTHALSRRLQQSHGLSLDSCAVICHQQQVRCYSSGYDSVFSLTRNPLTKEAKTAAFNEEGRMHMTLSLIMACEGEIANGDEGARELQAHLAALCPDLRLAGGTIADIGKVIVTGIPESEQQTRRLLRGLLPGFALLDRSPLLTEHFSRLKQVNPEAEMIDAWLDFAAIKMQAEAEPQNNASGAAEDVQWKAIPKPASGYLVPLMVGYRAISPLYAAGEVANSRDADTPFAFAESIYGVGEWRGLHRLGNMNELFWRHQAEGEIYCCSSRQGATDQDYSNIDFE